jgi:hypothetical protein
MKKVRVMAKRKQPAPDYCIVIETVTPGSVYHGPFPDYDTAYDWKVAMEAFVKKHNFDWTYSIRTLRPPIHTV